MVAKIKTSPGSKSHRGSIRPKGVSKKAFERIYWPYIPLLIVISLLLPLAGQTGALKAALHDPSGKVLAYATSMSDGGLLSSTNAQRAGNGVGALNLNGQLDAAAQAKADEMPARNYWSHNTPEGNPPWVFVTAQGYSYQKAGENLAAGFDNEQAVIDGWMASPSHRQNMLDSAYIDVGFGFANNPDYTSAGGGPMTIAVAFYGQPVGATAPPPASTPVTGGQQTTVQNKPSPPAPSQPALSPNPPASKDKQPVTSQSQNSSSSPSQRTSRAQIGLANFGLYSYASGAAMLVALAALGIWASRHIVAIRRVVVRGEAFIVHHPLLDIGLLCIAALSYILSQTAGFIK